MPASTQHIQVMGKYSLEEYLRNPPIDQIATDRPWIRKLRAMKRLFGGALEHVVVQVRKSYDSNAQWYFGDQEFVFNRRDTIEQALFRWYSIRDGYTLTDDDFVRNGLTVSQDSRVTMSGSEFIQLTNLFDEKNTALSLGFEQKLSQGFHRNGSATTEDIKGLDLLVGRTVGSATVGGLAESTYTWWRNNVDTGLTQANMIDTMEKAFRRCQRNGGRPDYIMAGPDYIDMYRAAAKATGELQRYIVLPVSGAQPKMDAGTGMSVDGGVMTGLVFKGIPILYNPEFEDLDDIENPPANMRWSKRAYMLNCRHITEMPVRGYDEVSYTPPTVYNREAHFFAVRWKGALLIKRRNAQWVGVLS